MAPDIQSHPEVMTAPAVLRLASTVLGDGHKSNRCISQDKAHTRSKYDNFASGSGRPVNLTGRCLNAGSTIKALPRRTPQHW